MERAELIVDHTAVPEPATPSDGVPSGDATAVKRGNYLTVLALMFGAAVKYGARGASGHRRIPPLCWLTDSAESGLPGLTTPR